MSIRILLADDHKIVREGLRFLLEKHPEMEVVAEAENGRTAVELTVNLKPDVVIIDVAMPDLNGIEATRKIMAEALSTKVIALSMHSDRRFVKEMFRAGASGYLLKDCAFDELSDAIHAVIVNKTYLSPKVATIIAREYLYRLSEGEPYAFSLLTPREREVLQLLSEGKTTKDIAYSLKISAKTVNTHQQHIMKKLGVNSLADLTKFAVREGLTSLEP
jgi:DNA-binding NarL/FixJ family response regulator